MTMKTLLRSLLLALTVGLAAQVSAQSLEIRDSLTNVLNNDTLWLPGTGSESVIKSVLRTENMSQATLEVKMKRWEVSVPPGTENYFCWSLCYNAQDAGDRVEWEDNTPVYLVPDSVYKKLQVYHKPHGETGVAVFRYKLWDRANPDDSASFHVIFAVPLGIFGPSTPRPNGEVSLAPNPADGWVNFTYKGNANGTNRELVVFDLLGNQVALETLATPSGSFTLNTEEYVPGIYVMSLRENGQLIATKKLVVDR